MRYLPVLLILIIGCKVEELKEVTECGKPCYEKARINIGKGVCSPGVWSCDDTGAMTCQGATYPSQEVCDGLDNDCIGGADNFWMPCSTLCGTGLSFCGKGIWETCSAKAPVPEVCNGKDDDCDGIIDNENELPVEFCYEGPKASLTFPSAPCGPGITRCANGKEVCAGQVLPKAETCDSVDQNCNGIVDDGVVIPRDLDIVFVIDNSGSMGPTIEKVKTVVSQFAQKYAGRVDLRWGLVGAPDPDYFKEAPTMQLDFTDANTLAGAMMNQAPSGFNNEPTIDAIDMIINPDNPLGFTWKYGAKKSIVVFSDEPPQAYFTSSTYDTLKAKIQNLPGEPLAGVVVFIDGQFAPGKLGWEVAVGVGNVYEIASSESEIGKILDRTILIEGCRP